MIVVDASVVANVIGDDGAEGRRPRSELRVAGQVAAPALVDVETVVVLHKRWLAGALSERRFVVAIDDLAAIDVHRYPTLALMRRAFDLRANVTAYDATHVALAEGLPCELLTGDGRLTNASDTPCAIRLLW